MFTYLCICVARLLYSRFPACEPRDTVVALAYMSTRGESVYHGSLTHVCPGGIDTTHFPGWDLLVYKTVVLPGGIYGNRGI